MIDGCSAGAGSTANHAVNEHSWPFFAKAAGESGMFAMWNSNTLATAESVFQQLSNFTGCGGGGRRGDAHDNAVSCLQGKSAADIIRASALLPDLMLNIPRIDKIVWAPVIDSVDTIGHPCKLTLTYVTIAPTRRQSDCLTDGDAYV
jgi:carboxylesterase type B